MEGFLKRGGGLSSPDAARSWGSSEEKFPSRAPRPVIGQGRAGGAPRPMGLGVGKRWYQSHLPIVLLYTWYPTRTLFN